MKNKKLLEKLKEDMEMRGFSHYTKDSVKVNTKTGSSAIYLAQILLK